MVLLDELRGALNAHECLVDVSAPGCGISRVQHDVIDTWHLLRQRPLIRNSRMCRCDRSIDDDRAAVVAAAATKLPSETSAALGRRRPSKRWPEPLPPLFAQLKLRGFTRGAFTSRDSTPRISLVHCRWMTDLRLRLCHEANSRFRIGRAEILVFCLYW